MYTRVLILITVQGDVYYNKRVRKLSPTPTAISDYSNEINTCQLNIRKI